MTRARVRPYRTVRLEHQPDVRWCRVRGETEQPLTVEDWDPATDLHIRAVVDIDPNVTMADCGFETGQDIRLFLGWAADGTRMRGGALSAEAVSGPRGARAIDVIVPGSEVAGRLELDVSLVLHGGPMPGRFVAHERASVLWSTRKRVSLSDSGTRFPIEVADFSSIPGIDPDAPWYLDWDPQAPSMPVLGGLRLMVNSRVPRVVDAVVTGSGSGEAAAIREAVRYDVARAMISGAIDNWKSEDLIDLESGTVGVAVSRLISAVFPGRSLEAVSAAYEYKPFAVDAGLLGFFKTFGESPGVMP